jgi:hypothetical protein
MAERLATLPAKQVAWVRFPVLHVASTAIALYKWIQKLQLQVVCGDLRLDCLCRPAFVAGVLGLTIKSKQFNAKVSHIL